MPIAFKGGFEHLLKGLAVFVFGACYQMNSEPGEKKEKKVSIESPLALDLSF